MNIFRDKILLYVCLGYISFVIGTLLYFPRNLWEACLLFLTSLLVLWYTAETRGLRQESHEMNRLSVHPALSLYYTRKNGTGDWQMLLSNQGKGAAFNPEIKILNHQKLKFELNGINALNPEHETPITWQFEGKQNDQAVLQQFDQKPLEIEITFVSMLNIKTILITRQKLWNPPKSIITFAHWY